MEEIISFSLSVTQESGIDLNVHLTEEISLKIDTVFETDTFIDTIVEYSVER